MPRALKVFHIISIIYTMNRHPLSCSNMMGNPCCEKCRLGQCWDCCCSSAFVVWPTWSTTLSLHVLLTTSSYLLPVTNWGRCSPTCGLTLGSIGERFPVISYDNTGSYFESTVINKVRLMCMKFMSCPFPPTSSVCTCHDLLSQIRESFFLSLIYSLLYTVSYIQSIL